MKLHILILGAFFCQFGFGQMTVDLGSDTVFCANNDSILLGTSLVITNGNAPYTYSWHIVPYAPFGTFYIHTCDLLNDTTIANPIVFSSGLNDTVEYFLTVIDSTGQIAFDSIQVYFPLYAQGLGYTVHYIIQGDSISLGDSNLDSDIQVVSYLWRPNHGLLDSTNATFWTKPDYSIGYNVTVTDIHGCLYNSGLSCLIIISYLNLDEALNSNKTFSLYPNPTTGSIQLKDEEKQTKNVQIFDASGKFITEIMPTEFPYDMSHFAKGSYFLHIQMEVGAEIRTVVLE